MITFCNMIGMPTGRAIILRLAAGRGLNGCYTAGVIVGISRRPRRSAALLAAALTAVALAAAACSQASANSPKGIPNVKITPPPTPTGTAPPVGQHGGVNLNVLVVSDGTSAVDAIKQELSVEGLPSTVIDLRQAGRTTITRGYLARHLPNGALAGNFDGIVLPGTTFSGLSARESGALAWYESRFGVRQVDAYSPPMANLGMSSPPAYSGPLSGTAGVTRAGASAGFGYLKNSFPFSGGAAGIAPFGYLAHPEPGGGATPLVTMSVPHSGSGALVWQYNHAGRQELGVGFGYNYGQAQFHYLAHGIVDWVTSGVNLGNWHNYLDIAYDDMFLGDASWSPKYHCTPGASICPKGTPMTPTIRMKPADVDYAVQWEKQHHFKIEFLYNGGASKRFAVNGVDKLLVATRPVAKDFYWVNHTWTHAYFGCTQNFKVVPWQCVRSNGQIQWAASVSLVYSQINKNFEWAKQEGIPAQPGLLASGEYSGLLILPQQPVDNPNMLQGMADDHIKWIVMDASREPTMRNVGPALGIPRHPIDVGYDVDTVANEVNEFNWYNDSKADGGSGFCETSKTTMCRQPLDNSGWLSTIVPGQVQIVYRAVLQNDARPFFMHQSNLTGDRLGYPVMDGVLGAYRAVFNASAPIVNDATIQDGVVLRNQQLWADAVKAGKITAWVQGHTVTISGPKGTPVPVTAPHGTKQGTAAFGSAYGGDQTAFVTLGSQPLKLTLPAAPYHA
jgi:hypothetical protein